MRHRHWTAVLRLTTLQDENVTWIDFFLQSLYLCPTAAAGPAARCAHGRQLVVACML